MAAMSPAAQADPANVRPEPPLAGRRVEGWLAAAAFALMAGWFAYHALTTRGVLRHDELGHLLVARDAWERPRLIFNPWGRPANTLFFMPVAGGPLWGARLWAAAMSLLAAGLVWGIGRRMSLSGAPLAPLWLLLQPLFLGTGWMALTQPPMTLMATLAAWLALAGRWRLAALTTGILPLIRHEGIVLLAFMGALSGVRRRYAEWLLLLSPLALANGLALALFGDFPSSTYFSPRPTDHYGAATFEVFASGLRDAAGAPCLVLVLIGLVESLRRPGFALYVAANFVYLATLGGLRRFGLYGAGGHPIIFLPLAPALALLAAEGLAWVGGRAAENLAQAWPRLASLAPKLGLGLIALGIVAGLGASRRYPRVQVEAHERAIDEAIAYLRAEQPQAAPVVSAHVWFFYYMPRPIPRADFALWIAPPPLESLAPGTIVLWEPRYADLHTLARSRLEDPQGPWERLWSSGEEAALFKRVR